MDEIIDLYENPNDSFEEDNGDEDNDRPERGEEGQEGDGENENPENAEKVDVEAKKPKRVVRKMFRLNAALLKGPRGITAIPSYFENIKLKGNYVYFCQTFIPFTVIPFQERVTKNKIWM
jgi:hypothetical protein